MFAFFQSTWFLWWILTVVAILRWFCVAHVEADYQQDKRGSEPFERAPLNSGVPRAPEVH